jgi:NADH-quinone oxidoreductase subunit J
MERLFFYFFGIMMVIFAVMAVSSRNMMRTIIYLLFVMLGMAGIYFLLHFNFLAAVQLSVYAGGVIVLYINSVMLINRIGSPMERPKLWKQLLTGMLSVLGLGAALFAVYQYPFKQANTVVETTTAQLGKQLLSYGEHGFILPFELISMFLLAALVGAIAIAKSGKTVKK